MHMSLHGTSPWATDEGIGDIFAYAFRVFADLAYILLNFGSYFNNLKKFKKKKKSFKTWE